MRVALHKPLLGWGQWNWWRNGDFRPWSLWLLVLGMYGLIGLAAFASILFLPVLRTVWPFAGRYDANDANLRLALVALILMTSMDSLLNGTMILPYLLIIGGMSASQSATPLPA